MARNFRFYEKKRGNRSTSSKRVGNLGEAAFLGAFLALGCAGVVLILMTLVIPEWRTNHVFVEDVCTVLDKRIEQREGREGIVYRPEVCIEYEVGGQRHCVWTYDIRRAEESSEEAAQKVLDRFAAGEKHPCWYDPSNPAVAVLARGYSWWFWLTLVVPVSFILLGSGGLLYSIFTWGKSVERRAALVKQAAGLELVQAARGNRGELPCVPGDAAITDSPGTTLAFRLPPGAGRHGR